MNTEHFKQKLQQELQTVEKELNTLGWKDPETGEWEATDGDLETMSPTQDSNEYADQLEELHDRESQIPALEGRRSDIKEALLKIEQGAYGTCEVCGEKIEEDRLEANPAAKTCKAHM